MTDRFEADPSQLGQVAQGLAGVAADLRAFQSQLSGLEGQIASAGLLARRALRQVGDARGQVTRTAQELDNLQADLGGRLRRLLSAEQDDGNPWSWPPPPPLPPLPPLLPPLVAPSPEPTLELQPGELQPVLGLGELGPSLALAPQPATGSIESGSGADASDLLLKLLALAAAAAAADAAARSDVARRLADGLQVLFAKKEAPKLSPEEQEALDNKDARRPYDKKAYNRARRKLNEGEKYRGDRNKQKRRSN